MIVVVEDTSNSPYQSLRRTRICTLVSKAIHKELRDILGIRSEIECGVKNVWVGHTETTLELDVKITLPPHHD